MKSATMKPAKSVNNVKQRTLVSPINVFLLISIFCLSHHLVEGSSNPKLFPYGLSQLDSSLPRDIDDISAPELRLSSPITFFGQTYQGIYINQNGVVTFLTDMPLFVNMPFPLDYPSIAPFYSDVDTRIEGAVYYRETQADEILERARTLFSDHFSSATNFQPLSVVIVTWDGVGYFDRKNDKVFKGLKPKEELNEPTTTNTYQLVIGSDGTESYVVFLYDKIEWIQGTGKNPNMPDAKAQAGLNSGQGPYHSLKGSGTDQVSSIHKRSNVNEEGVWMFRVGRVGDKLEEPDLNVILDSSSESSSSCGAGGSTSCHSQAQCVDYDPGYCCQCSRGYFGNGRVCLTDVAPMRLTGKVKGVLNGVALEDADLFSYIMPGDGRSYTAIAKIPVRVGYELQTVITLGTSIAWLFSVSSKGAPNGFTITGGVLNYTSDIAFPQTGQKVQVYQNFLGLDVFSNMRADTRVHGSAPLVPVGKAIVINEIKMEFTRVSPGLIRSRSSHSYGVEGTSTQIPFTVEQTIEYDECPWASPVPPELDTIAMKIGRNYIVYEPLQNISRYAISSKVSPVDGEDPCKDNKDKCGEHSSCVVEGDEFRCICNLGYEAQYNYDDMYGDPETSGRSNGGNDPPVCVDVDECQIGTSTCDVTAVCHNSPGGYSCQCQPGYSGDGYTCTKILSCTDVQCGRNAQCFEHSVGNPECRCLPGFYGDGLFCYEPTGVDVTDGGGALDCRQARNLCDPFAECIYSDSSNSYICSCQPGYTGDGLVCHREAPVDEESCDIINNCHLEAVCRLDDAQNEYTCMCKPGYVGDGYNCMRSHHYNNPQYPDGSAEAPPQPICVLGACYCSPGFLYDDERGECKYSTSPEASSTERVDCVADRKLCDPNANCIYDTGKGRYECVCNAGFTGSGRECTAQDLCSTHTECSPYGGCLYDPVELKYACRCRQGFIGDGKDCRPEGNAGCDILRNCDENGQCSWSGHLSKWACECKPGFRGDGLTCQEDVMGCNVLQNCGRHAECQYDSEARGYRCSCSPGFEGDGYRCRSTVPCYQDRSICDENADCAPDSVTQEWKCQCRTGFQGDGQQCRAVSSPSALAKEQIIVAKGMYIIQIPLGGGGSSAIPITVDPFQTATGIDIDCPSQKVYWSDVGTRSIKIANYNGSERTAFLDDDIASPEGLSVDWASGNLYWTDSTKDTIEVVNLKSKARAVIISTGLVNPRGIAVYPQRGRLFWSDWNREYPKIEFSGLDGQERQILVGEGLALPNSLVVDTLGDQLCWADAGTHKIECVNVDGRSRRAYVSNVKYPFGLALGSNIFYWSDWETKKVESAAKDTGELLTSYDVSHGGPGKLYGLVYIPSQCPQTYSPCEHSSCGEERICLPNLRGHRSCKCSESASPSCQDLM